MDSDHALMSIVQRTEFKLDQFLDTVFDFLRRNSDFFKIITPDDPDSGFLPGEAANIVREVFQYQQAKYLRDSQTTIPKPPPAPRPTPDYDPISTSGGGSSDNFRWGQCWDSVDIQIPLDKQIQSVVFNCNGYRVNLIGGEPITGHCSQQIVPDESTWQRDGKSIIITLAKKDNNLWWDRAHSDDSQCITTPERRIQDLEPRHQIDVINTIDQHHKKQKGDEQLLLENIVASI